MWLWLNIPEKDYKAESLVAVPVLEIIAPRFSEGHNVFQHDDVVYGIV